jgi:sugar/nucleoside kinase (ribokinase family)
VVSPSPVRFVVIGDSTLDVTVRSDVEPMPGRDHPALIEVGPGGQGANLAVRLARRGHHVRLVTGIGTDPMGAELSARLAAEGVAVSNLGARRTGMVVALLDAAGERAMLSDRASLAASAWTAGGADLMADATWIHVSGYPLADSSSGAALAEAVAARRADQRASVGGGSFTDGAGIGDRVRVARPDLVLFDRAEAAAVAGVRDDGAGAGPAEGLATRLAMLLGAVAVVTNGPAGAAAAAGRETVAVAGEVRPLVDATGAGDAHAAAVLDLLAGGAWPPTAADLRRALEVAGAAGAKVAGLVGAQAKAPSEGPA